MLTGSAAVVKYLLFIFNFIFVITGIAILSVGAVIQAEYITYEGLLEQNYYSVPSLLIAIGVIIFIVAFFGCCGSIRENYCMVLTFATLMIIIFLLELAAGIAGYRLRDQTGVMLEKNMNDSMKHYNSTNPLWSGSEWDVLQMTEHCCGTNGPQDWLSNSDNIFNTTIAVPLSCCGIANNACNFTAGAGTDSGIYQAGCLTALTNEIVENAATLGGAAIGIAVVQMVGVILSCALAKNIKQGYESV